MSEINHPHTFPERPKRRAVGFCSGTGCTAVRVWTGRRWRELTNSEKVSLIAIQIEDVAIAQAMQIIHGKERGLQRAREVLGYSR